jgi:hypothetical protein
MATRLTTPAVCTAASKHRSALGHARRALGHATGVAAMLLALGHFVVGRSGALSLPRSPLPLAVHDALEFALGMKHVEPHLEGHWYRLLLALSRRAARLPGELPPRSSPWPASVTTRVTHGPWANT